MRAFVSAVGGVLLGGVLWAAPATPVADRERIVTSIAGLGSNSFRERESAMKDLEAIGEPALDKLREAAKSTDPEVATRAAKLVDRIAAKARTAKLLAPTMVELSLKDVSIPQALAELSRQSGYNVIATLKPEDRRITLETGRVPFFKALEMLCQQADLVEMTFPSSATVRPVRPFPLPVPAPIQLPIRIQPILIQPLPAPVEVEAAPVKNPMAIQRPKRQPAPPILLEEGPPVRIGGGPTPVPTVNPIRPTIALQNGKPDTFPTHIEGPLRISVRPADSLRLPIAPPKGADDESLSILVVDAEPKFPIVAIVGVRIKRAIDDKNREVAQLLVPKNGDPNVGTDAIANLRTMKLRQMEALSPGTSLRSGTKIWPIAFDKLDKSATSFAELSGTVGVSVRMPTDVLVEIDGLDKNGTGSGNVKTGGTMEVTGLRKNADGSHSIDIRTAGENPVNGGAVRGNVIIQGGGRMIINGSAIAVPSPDEISLLDKDGNPLTFAIAEATAMESNGASYTFKATLRFRKTDKSGDPVKLVRTGSSIETIEVPFSLKNVPLK